MRRFTMIVAGLSVGLFGFTATSAAPMLVSPPAGDGHGEAAPTPKPKGASKKTPVKSAPPATTGGDGHAKPKGDASHADDHKSDAHAAPMDTSDPAEAHAPAAEASKPVTAAEALKMLEEGNARWVAGASEDPNTGTARRGELAANGQHPFVTVLTCADSRLPVERLFDRGVGDVFVARVAGAVAADGETGTIEYGVGHLHTPLLVVMGHTKCGAVAAAVAGVEVHGKVAGLIDAIEPAVARAKRNNAGVEGDALAAVAVKENVWQSMFDLLKHSPEIRGLVQKGELTVVGAVCDISTGKVEFMGEHPWQSELMAAMDGKGLHAEPGDTKAVTGVTDAAGH